MQAHTHRIRCSFSRRNNVPKHPADTSSLYSDFPMAESIFLLHSSLVAVVTKSKPIGKKSKRNNRFTCVWVVIDALQQRIMSAWLAEFSTLQQPSVAAWITEFDTMFSVFSMLPREQPSSTELLSPRAEFRTRGETNRLVERWSSRRWLSSRPTCLYSPRSNFLKALAALAALRRGTITKIWVFLIFKKVLRAPVCIFLKGDAEDELVGGQGNFSWQISTVITQTCRGMGE